MPEIDISENGLSLLKLLKNLKRGKAAGPDRLKPFLLRELREEITPIIKPFKQERVKVMPVFKKGDTSLALNYRPISFTCILFKVLEPILASSIIEHIDGQGLMYGLQYSFR